MSAGRHCNGLLLALLVALCVGCGQDAEAELDQNARRFPEGFKIENYRWSGNVVEDGLIDARNPYGGFRSRTSPDDTVQVTAQIQKLRPDQPEMEFIIKESEHGLVVTVGKAAYEMAELGDGPDDGFPGRIDLSILIPKGRRLKAQTVDGDIQVDGDGMSNDIEAIARDGNIKIVTRGRAQARTRGGNVSVWLGGKSWPEPLDLTTKTGKIVVEMMDFAHLAVHARTTGEIRTQFAAGLSPQTQRKDGTLSFVLNQGHSDLKVQSESGIVELNVVKKLTAKL